MHIYRVVGTVTLSKSHPTTLGAVLKLAEPFGESLVGNPPADPDAIVVWDELGASVGSIIAVADGGENYERLTPRVCYDQRT